jgi:hypothetical protein
MAPLRHAVHIMRPVRAAEGDAVVALCSPLDDRLERSSPTCCGGRRRCAARASSPAPRSQVDD